VGTPMEFLPGWRSARKRSKCSSSSYRALPKMNRKSCQERGTVEKQQYRGVPAVPPALCWRVCAPTMWTVHVIQRTSHPSGSQGRRTVPSELSQFRGKISPFRYHCRVQVRPCPRCTHVVVQGHYHGSWLSCDAPDNARVHGTECGGVGGCSVGLV